jgi:hypothetical protein
MSDSTRYTYGTCSWVDASSPSAQYQRDPAIEEDTSDSPSRAPVTSTPTWRILVEKRARRLALVRMGMQGCVPSENRNRLSPSHWCNGRATFVHAEQEANALHVLAPYTAAHWSAVAARSRPCHVIRAQARLEQGSRLVTTQLVRGRLLATLWACA